MKPVVLMVVVFLALYVCIVTVGESSILITLWHNFACTLKVTLDVSSVSSVKRGEDLENKNLILLCQSAKPVVHCLVK